MEKKEAYKFTGEDAENYDFYLGPILFEPYAEYLVSRIEVNGVNSVLELACGTGRVTRHLRKALPDHIKLLSTDISNDMLNVAKNQLNDITGVDYRIEDIQNLSFPDNSFDLAICQFGMMFLPDKNKGFSEIFRVLKPGGKLMFFTWDATVNMPLFKQLINDLILPYFEDEDTKRFFTPFSLYDPHVLKNLLQTAGFKETKTEHVVLRSGSTVLRNISDGLFRKHPLGKEIMAKEPSAFEPIAKKFEEIIASQYGAVNPEFDLSAFLTTGIK